MRVFMPTGDAATDSFGEVPLTDTPETRTWLETLAIPKCLSWRVENPFEALGVLYPALYCCSAYCPRCAGMRELDEVEELIPNAWIHEATGPTREDDHGRTEPGNRTGHRPHGRRAGRAPKRKGRPRRGR